MALIRLHVDIVRSFTNGIPHEAPICTFLQICTYRNFIINSRHLMLHYNRYMILTDANA